MAEKLCNLCGLSCNLSGVGSESWVQESGLIDAAVRGGFLSTPGNGYGALDDTVEYKFSLCEFCLDWLFNQFKIPVDMRDTDMDPPAIEFKPAAILVQEDEWRKDKDRFFEEYKRRNRARLEGVKGVPIVERASLIDDVYNELDELLLSSRYEEARVRMLGYATGNYPLAVLMGIMMITYPWREQLREARHEVSMRILQVAHKIGGEDKVAEVSRFLSGQGQRL